MELQRTRDREAEAGRIEGIKGIKGIGEVGEVGPGSRERKKSGAQNGRMSIRLPPYLSPD